MTLIEKTTVAASEALQETKANLITSLTEALKKFPGTLADKLRALFSQSQGQATDKADLNNPGYLGNLQAKYEEAAKAIDDPGYLANLQTKYEEAITAIDDAVYGSNDENEFWNQIEVKLKVALEATPADQADWQLW